MNLRPACALHTQVRLRSGLTTHGWDASACGSPRLSMDTSHLAWFLRSSFQSAPGERRALWGGRMARRRGSAGGLLLIGGVLLVAMCRGEGGQNADGSRAGCRCASVRPTAGTVIGTHAGHGQRAQPARRARWSRRRQPVGRRYRQRLPAQRQLGADLARRRITAVGVRKPPVFEHGLLPTGDHAKAQRASACAAHPFGLHRRRLSLLRQPRMHRPARRALLHHFRWEQALWGVSALLIRGV